MKRCAYCGKEYPDEATECVIDHQPLESFPSESQPAADASRDDEKSVTIEIFANREIAGLAAGKLEVYGISCWLKSDDASGMYPNLTMAGGVRLQVRAMDVETAVALLNAQASASEVADLEAQAVAAPPMDQAPTIKFAPAQIMLGIGLGIVVCLLCQLGDRSGAKIDYTYASNGQRLEAWIYQNGHLTKMKKDRNLDGEWDEWVYYHRGWLVRSELDNNFDGKPDEWLTYSNGSTATLEKDTDFNGVPDEFCTYQNGVLQQMEVRPNGAKFATQRWIYQKCVLSEIWLGGDSNGIFKKIIKYDSFLNATNAQLGEFRFSRNKF